MRTPFTQQLRRYRRGHGTVALIMLLAVGLLSTTAADVAASSTWTARLGSGGVNGTAAFTWGTSSSGSASYKFVMSIRRFRAVATYPVTVRRGTCSSLGRLVTTMPSIRIGSAGTATRKATLSATTGAAIRSALRVGRVAVRVGTRCGVFPSLATVSPGPTPSPTPPPVPPVPTLGPGLGVPVVAPDNLGSVVVLAAEPWTNPTMSPASGNAFVTLQLLAQASPGALEPARFVLHDTGGAGHLPLAQGRSPQVPTANPGWLTYELPAGQATDVTLVWSLAGVDYRIPLRVAPPAGPSPVRLAYDGTPTGLEGGTIRDAVGTPTGYVAVGFVADPPFSDQSTGTVWTSTDGSHWQVHQPATLANAELWAIARGSTGRLVAVGAANRNVRPQQAIWTSDDQGATWARVTGLPTDLLPLWATDVSALGTGFVVAGSILESGSNFPHAVAMTSPDGRTWTRSSFVDGATNHGFRGLVPTPAGIVGYGECGEELNGAVAWHSSNGDRWQRTLDDCVHHAFNGGGAEPVEMELVFAARAGLVAFASATDFGDFPRVFDSVAGTTWTRLPIGGAMRGFVPKSAATLSDGSSLVVGRGPHPVNAFRTQQAAWQYTLDGRWLPVAVDQPEFPDLSGTEVEAVVLVPGPAGLLALGNRADRAAPYQLDGVSWHVIQP